MENAIQKTFYYEAGIAENRIIGEVEMNKRKWKEFKKQTQKCYLTMVGVEESRECWDKAYNILKDIITDGREEQKQYAFCDPQQNGQRHRHSASGDDAVHFLEKNQCCGIVLRRDRGDRADGVERISAAQSCTSLLCGTFSGGDSGRNGPGEIILQKKLNGSPCKAGIHHLYCFV